MVGYSNHSESGEYIWPDLKDSPEGAISKINDYLQELVGVVADVPSNIQGKSIRKGSANEVIRTMGIEIALRFGNWDNGYCSIMEYYDLMDEERIQCAKRLAGFVKDDRCYPPR
jgi:hypothetical protein